MWGFGDRHKALKNTKPVTLNWRGSSNLIIPPKAERKLSKEEMEELYQAALRYKDSISPNLWVTLASDPEVSADVFRIVDQLQLYKNFTSQEWYNLIVYAPDWKKAFKLAKLDDGRGFRLLNESHWIFFLKNKRSLFGDLYKKYYTCQGVGAACVFGETMCI